MSLNRPSVCENSLVITRALDFQSLSALLTSFTLTGSDSMRAAKSSSASALAKPRSKAWIASKIGL
jgi:hypothetical protein